MSRVTWEMITINSSPYTGTVIFGQNEGDKQWIFIRSNCSTVLKAKIWSAGDKIDETEIRPYGIAVPAVPAEATHRLVEIGFKSDNEDWNWTYHNYDNGATTPA